MGDLSYRHHIAFVELVSQHFLASIKVHPVFQVSGLKELLDFEVI